MQPSSLSQRAGDGFRRPAANGHRGGSAGDCASSTQVSAALRRSTSHDTRKEGWTVATLGSWEPLSELATLRSELSRLMNGLSEGNGAIPFGAPGRCLGDRVQPRVYAFDLPGISQDKIALDLHDDTLTTSRGARERTSGPRNGFFPPRAALRQLQPLSCVPRTPEESVRAEHRNGVLEVRVAKPEVKKPRRIKMAARPARPTRRSKATPALDRRWKARRAPWAGARLAFHMSVGWRLRRQTRVVKQRPGPVRSAAKQQIGQSSCGGRSMEALNEPREERFLELVALPAEERIRPRLAPEPPSSSLQGGSTSSNGQCAS